MRASLRLRDPRSGRFAEQIDADDAASTAQQAAALRAAAPGWSSLQIEARCAALEAFAQACERHREPLIEALLRDTGRWRESVLEVDATIASLRRWAQQAPQALAVAAPTAANIPFIEVRQRLVPFELVGVISPWNFPLLLTLIDAIPALAAGSVVLAKPSEITPRFVAPLRQALAEVPELAAAFALLVGDGSVGAALIEAVDLLCFTGSVRTGRQVGEVCARRFIPAFLELGGKDPALVLEGCDIARAARAIAWGGLVNAGQSCMSIERVLVERAIAEPFTAALVSEASALRLAYPDPQLGEIGPIISAAQVEVVRGHLDEALARGARALCGGAIEHHGGGAWCPPTVLVDVPADARVLVEESFASILPIEVVDDVEAAIAAANRSAYGLSAAVFAASSEIAEQVAARLQVGAVSLNDAALTSLVHSGEKHSFKASGLGGSRMGPASIRRFVRSQALLVNPGVDDPWWFSPGRA